MSCLNGSVLYSCCLHRSNFVQGHKVLYFSINLSFFYLSYRTFCIVYINFTIFLSSSLLSFLLSFASVDFLKSIYSCKVHQLPFSCMPRVIYTLDVNIYCRISLYVLFLSLLMLLPQHKFYVIFESSLKILLESFCFCFVLFHIKQLFL